MGHTDTHVSRRNLPYVIDASLMTCRDLGGKGGGVQAGPVMCVRKSLVAKVLLAMVALGRATISKDAFLSHARPERGPDVLRHHASAVRVKQQIGLTKEFAQKHGGLAGMFEACAKLQGSQWKVKRLDGEVAPEGYVTIASVARAFTFVRAVRRVMRTPCLGGKYAEP